MDKNLKVGEDEWRERERREQNFERERKSDAILPPKGIE